MKRTGIALTTLAVTAFTVAALQPEDAPTSARGESAWSCQLHLHGSFSEGVASIDSHSWEARDVGADVLWWSDHDFRITSHGMADGFGFEHKQEDVERDTLVSSGKKSMRGLWLYEKHADRREVGGWEIVDDHVEGEKAMRMWVVGKNERFGGRYIRLGADNSSLGRPLAAGIRLRLAVKPGVTGLDSHAVVLIDLSEHPVEPRGEELEIEQTLMRYVIGGVRFEPFREGSTYTAWVDATDGEWNELVFELTQDVERGFPEIVGRDNSMNRIGFGVEARQSVEFECLFDDLRVEQAVPSSEMFAVQRATIDEVAQRYPSLRQLQGAEVSYASEHMNEFSVETELLDYAAIAAELEAAGEATPERFRQVVLERAIDGAHARGGLISFNHMFGASWVGNTKNDKRRSALEEVRELIAHGIDLLEVGYVARGGQRLSDHLWVWDKLASEGLPVIGTGVSDSHGGEDQRWRDGENNFVSWIYAPTTDKADLIEGLRAGRVFFGDLVTFDGALDLLSDHGHAMGQVVLTDREQVQVGLYARGARPNHTLHVIESGTHVDTLFLKQEEFEHALAIAPDGPTFLRVVLHDRRDTPKVFTNALHYVREAPPEGLPAARAGLDFAGLVVVRFEAFDLLGAEREADGTVVVRGLADGGSFTLDTREFGSEVSVTLVDLEGEFAAVEGGFEFSKLAGSGTIRIRAAP